MSKLGKNGRFVIHQISKLGGRGGPTILKHEKQDDICDFSHAYPLFSHNCWDLQTLAAPHVLQAQLMRRHKALHNDGYPPLAGCRKHSSKAAKNPYD
jgi:hypothetical protein